MIQKIKSFIKNTFYLEDNKTGGKVCFKLSLFWCRIFKWVVIGLFILVAIVLIFGAGVFVGTMKAKFSYRWAESYHKNFSGPKSGFLGDWRQAMPMPGDFIQGHGAFGEIIEMKDNGFVIKGQGDAEKVVIVNENTIIQNGRETVKDGLKVGDNVVVIGSPNDQGQIEARLIRIMLQPSPTNSMLMPPKFFR